MTTIFDLKFQRMKWLYKTLVQKWTILPIVAIICFVFSLILKSNPRLSEDWYTQRMYPVISKILSSLSSIFPFSFSDVFYLLLIFMPLTILILLLLKRITFSRAGKIILNCIAGVYVLFYVLWGYNYFRLGLNERLNLAETEPNKNELLVVFEQLIEQTNSLYCNCDLINKTEIDSLIEDSYKNLAPALNLKYPMGKRKDKGITFSNFYSKTGITGYFGPFFNEVHVNKKVLPVEYPFILAHEKAHQFGITSEAEANFYAWMVCNFSNVQQVQYSANLIMLHHFIREVYSLEEYTELSKLISSEVKDDFNSRIKYWRRLRNKNMDKAASKMNDVYLKSNNVKKGIDDYHGVVEHVMNFSLDSAFQQRHNLVAW